MQTRKPRMLGWFQDAGYQKTAEAFVGASRFEIFQQCLELAMPRAVRF